MVTPKYSACTMRPDHHSPPTKAAISRMSSHQVSSRSSVSAIVVNGSRRRPEKKIDDPLVDAVEDAASA